MDQANAPTPDVPQKAVTLADIQHALARKWKQGCPMCGGQQWQTRALSRLPAAGAEGTHTYVMGAFVPVSCENCGATQMVDLETLLRFKLVQVVQ